MFLNTLQEIYGLKIGNWHIHNLNFIDISKYHSDGKLLELMKFNNNNQRELFKSFTSHPLISWHLELTQDTTIRSLDLITNITGDINRVGAIRMRTTNFVHSPCLICEYGDFTGIYKKRNEHEHYTETKSMIEEYRTGVLISKLNEKNFNNSIFYMNILENHINIGLKKWK